MSPAWSSLCSNDNIQSHQLTCPYSVYRVSDSDVYNELHVGIVVVIASSRNFTDVVSNLEILGVGFEVLRCDHHNKLNRKLFRKFTVAG